MCATPERMHNFTWLQLLAQRSNSIGKLWFRSLVWYASLLIMANIHCNYCLELQWTPLHMAAGEDHKKTVECLVNEGADVYSKNDDGVSVREYCTEYCSIEFK